jgi:PAS domain S-box-containing protein
MKRAAKTKQELVLELNDLRARLEEAEETLQAIRSGEVDAVVVAGPEGEQVYTLKGAERPYRALLEAMNEGALTIGTDGTILYSNNRFASLLGVSLKNVIGSSVYEFIPEAGARDFETLFEVGKKGAIDGEISLKTKEGDSLPIWFSGSSLSLDGVDVVCGIFTDLTDLRRKEKELETLVANAPDVIFRLDRNLRFVFVNPKITEVTGIPRDQFYGKTLLELGLPRNVCIYLGKIAQEIFDRRAVNEFEFNFNGPEGLRWFHARIVPEFDTHGDVETVLGIAHDITDLKRAELAYREERAFRDSITSSLHIGIAAIDLEGRQTYVNPSFCQMVGWSEEELEGAKFPFVYWPPEEMENITQAFQQVLSAKESSGSIELRFWRRSGERFDAFVLFSPLTDSQGSVIGRIGSIGDITEHKKRDEEIQKLNRELEQRVIERTAELEAATKRLQESEQKARLQLAELETIYDSAPVGLCVLDPQLTYVRLNRRLAEINGVPVEKHIGRTPWEVVPELAGQAEALLRQVLETGQPIRNVEINGETPAQPGILRTWLEHWLPLRNKAGEVIGINVVAEEISERKRGEEALRRSQEDLDRAQAVGQIGSWRLDVQHNILMWSDENHRIFGIPKGTPMTYETFLSTIHPDDRQYVDTQWQAGLRGEPYDIEHRIIVGGQVKWVREKAYLEFDDSGKLLGGFGITQDITERKRVEEEIKILNEDLKRQTGELENANKELESFAYSVSHDLKAPLIVASGFCERLSEFYGEKLDDRGKRYLRRVQESCQHMNLLIEDLLNLSKVTTSDINLQSIDLSDLVNSIATRLKETEPSREVIFFIEDGLTAKGDSRLLSVALENLLGNAWKYTSNCEQAKIEFGLTKTIGGDPAYFVRDNGCGFDMSLANRLFMPFQRLHGEEEFSGTGVGLATVQRIIGRHGGHIWAESDVDKGATFFFTLPS